MEKEIIEGNKLIAEFDGWEKTNHIDEEFGNLYLKDGESKYEDSFRYELSWNWLMPVVEKIGKDYDVRITWTANAIEVTYIDRPDIYDKSIADFGGFGSITNTWKCVVKFIVWYNQKYKK